MASVLKQTEVSAATGSPQPLVFNFEDVQSRAKEYLAEIQAQADQTIADAKVEAEKMLAKAKQDGIAQAQANVKSQVEKKAQQLSDQRCRTAIEACDQSMQELSSSTSEWLSDWRNHTVQIAAAMAEKLVRREMQDNDELLRVWLEEAIVAIRDDRALRVQVHPDDFAVAGRFLQKLAKSIPQAGSAEVLPNPEVQLGGCIVSSTHGQIDQQLETQLARLVEQLT